MVGVPLGRPTGERGFPSETPGAAFSECAGEVDADLWARSVWAAPGGRCAPGCVLHGRFFFGIEIQGKFQGTEVARTRRGGASAVPQCVPQIFVFWECRAGFDVAVTPAGACARPPR